MKTCSIYPYYTQIVDGFYYKQKTVTFIKVYNNYSYLNAHFICFYQLFDIVYCFVYVECDILKMGLFRCIRYSWKHLKIKKDI